jgi:hypothetical protein
MSRRWFQFLIIEYDPTLTLHKEKLEDAKEVIRIRQLKRDRQHNDQKKKGQKDNQR